MDLDYICGQMDRVTRSARPRLALHLAAGLLAGALYAFVDLVFDEKLGSGPLPAVLASIHTFVDHVLPVITGLLFGTVTYALAQRGRRAVVAAERAAVLGARLERVERDQAVWVLAASVLHEVRNPLHSLGLLIDDLTQQVGTDNPLVSELSDRARQQMERIEAQLLALRSLHDGGRPEPRPLALRALAESVVDDLGALASADQIGLKLNDGRSISALADPTYVRLILENLIANSLQALRPLPRPLLITLELDQTAEMAIILVRDNGPGPGSDDPASLFEPLRSTKAGGLGLGLAISRALARAQEGDLSYEGHTGGQTVFRLSLPMAPA